MRIARSAAVALRRRRKPMSLLSRSSRRVTARQHSAIRIRRAAVRKPRRRNRCASGGRRQLLLDARAQRTHVRAALSLRLDDAHHLPHVLERRCARGANGLGDQSIHFCRGQLSGQQASAGARSSADPRATRSARPLLSNRVIDCGAASSFSPRGMASTEHHRGDALSTSRCSDGCDHQPDRTEAGPLPDRIAAFMSSEMRLLQGH